MNNHIFIQGNVDTDQGNVYASQGNVYAGQGFESAGQRQENAEKFPFREIFPYINPSCRNYTRRLHDRLQILQNKIRHLDV